MACVITFNNKKYSYEEFASMLHDGELGKMVLEGLIDGSKLSGDISVLSKGVSQEKEIASQERFTDQFSPLEGEEADKKEAERSEFKYFEEAQKELPKSKYSKEEFESIITDGDFTVLTGENPMGKIYSDSDNLKMNEEAEKFLKERGYDYVPVAGKYGQAEHSFFVPNMSKKDAMEFALMFNQDSVLTPDGLIYQNMQTNDRLKSDDAFGIDVSKEDVNYATAIRLNDGDLLGFKVGVDFSKKGQANEDYQNAMSQAEEQPIASQANALKDVESTAKALGGVENEVLKNIGNKTYFHGSPTKGRVGIDYDTEVFYLSEKESYAKDFGKNINIYEVDDSNVYDVDKYGKDGYITDNEGNVFYDEDGEPVNVGWIEENLNVVEDLLDRGFNSIRDGEEFFVVLDRSILKTKPQAVAEAYHKAKEDGSNPELVSAVEEILSKPSGAEKPVASQAAPKMRQTIENEDFTNKEERKELVSNPESFQNPAVMADERKAAEDMTDDEINAVLESIKDMEINDENPKVLFPLIEAIKRASKSPDRKFMGKSIQELLPEAAKLASFAGKVLRFIQDLKTKSPELLSNTVNAMIEKYGNIRLSPEQKAEIEQISSEFVSTKQAYEQAVKEFNQNPDILNEKIKDHAYKMHEAANIKMKGLMARYTPPSIYKRIIANAQGNLLVAASHGVNAVSNLSRAVTQEAPKAIVKTAFDVAQNLYYFLSQNKDLMFKLGIISGSNGLVKAINPTLYQMKNNFLYGNQAQVDASMRDSGTSLHLKTVYDWITNPNSRVRVKGNKTFVAIGNKIYEEGKLEKESLMATESTELNAEMSAAALSQQGGVYQAFGNEVWKMKAAKHGNLVEEMPYPPAATEDQMTAINLQAQKKAYEMSTVPARGMMAKSALLQISGITAEITQRLTSTMDIMFNNPQSAAILEAEAGRLKITPEQLLEFAATNKEFKQYLDNRLKATTFQEDSTISGKIAKFEKGIREYLDRPQDSILSKSLSSGAKIAYVAAKLSALFVKTPLNIGIQLVDVCTYGSISFAKAVTSGAKIPSSQGAAKVMNQMKFRDNMAAGVVSFGLALAATAIVAAGCATGDYDSYDKKQLDLLQAAKTPLSSINLSAVERMLKGGSTEWLETDRIVPAKYFGLLGMSIMYFAGNANKSKKSKMKAVSSGTKSRVEEKEGYLDFALDIPRIVMSQSAVSSANTVLKAISDKESRSWPGVAKQYAQGVVAGLGMPGAVSKAVEEPTVPELIDASSSVKTAQNTAKYRVLGRFYERITGKQSGLPMKVDALGRKITSVPEGEDVTLYNLNPFQTSSYRKDPVASKILELYEQTQDPKVVPTKYRQGTLNRTASWDPTIEEFTIIGEDIEALNLKRGSMYYEALSSLFKSGASVYDENIEDYRLVPYDKLTPEQKKMYVTNTIKNVNNMFKPFLDQYLQGLAIRTGTPESEIKKGLVIDGYEEPEPDSDF